MDVSIFFNDPSVIISTDIDFDTLPQHVLDLIEESTSDTGFNLERDPNWTSLKFNKSQVMASILNDGYCLIE